MKINRLFDLNKTIKKDKVEKSKKVDKLDSYIGHRIFNVTYSNRGSTKKMTIHSSNIMSDKNSIKQHMDKFHKGSEIIEIEEVKK